MYPYQITYWPCQFCGRDAEQIMEAFSAGRYYRICEPCATVCRYAFTQREATAAEGKTATEASAQAQSLPDTHQEANELSESARSIAR